MAITPGGYRAFQNRPTTAGGSFSAHSAAGAVAAPYWVKLVRQGNSFTAYHSGDGVNWQIQPDNENTGADASPNPQTIPMGTNVYIGLAVCSHNTGVTCEAQFSDVKIIGMVTDVWQSRDIGIAPNAAEQLYVAVEDSTGKSEAVNHPDPYAVQLDAWQEWNIDLREFGDAGVDLTDVSRIYIGVGDRNNPSPGGGTGMIYFDDIWLCGPRCLLGSTHAADLNGDCIVDFRDFAFLADLWLQKQLWP